jgi:hypothetical protein
VQAVEEYLQAGGPLQWIGQISCRKTGSMFEAVDRAVDIGVKALYFHGGLVDNLYAEKDEATLRSWVDHAHSKGIPVGVAGHAPDAHEWVDSLDIVDFHAVCFFDCGSLHNNRGDKFQLGDAFRAVQTVRSIRKPCIGYKIMAAGRIDAQMAFEYAFQNIKDTDVVNVGMHRGDKDGIVEENVDIVRGILGR